MKKFLLALIGTFIVLGILLDFDGIYGLPQYALAFMLFVWGLAAALMFGLLLVFMATAGRMRSVPAEIFTGFFGSIILMFSGPVMYNAWTYTARSGLVVSLYSGVVLGLVVFGIFAYKTNCLSIERR